MQSAKRNAVWGVGMGRGLLEGVEVASPHEDQAELKVQGQHTSFSCVHILSAFVCRSQLLVHVFVV